MSNNHWSKKVHAVTKILPNLTLTYDLNPTWEFFGWSLSRPAAEGGVDEEAEGEDDDDDGGDERPLEADGGVAHLV